MWKLYYYNHTLFTHCSGLSIHRTQIHLPVGRFGCCWQSSCSVTEHSVESVDNRLRQTAHAECGTAMNTSQAITSPSLHTKELPNGKLHPRHKNYLYSQLRILIVKSSPCMIQYSFYWKLTLEEITTLLAISIYHQLPFLFNSNLYSTPPTSTALATITVRLPTSLSGWSWSETITNISGWEEKCCRQFVLKKRLTFIFKKL